MKQILRFFYFIFANKDLHTAKLVYGRWVDILSDRFLKEFHFDLVRFEIALDEFGFHTSIDFSE